MEIELTFYNFEYLGFYQKCNILYPAVFVKSIGLQSIVCRIHFSSIAFDLLVTCAKNTSFAKN